MGLLEGEVVVKLGRANVLETAESLIRRQGNGVACVAFVLCNGVTLVS